VLDLYSMNEAGPVAVADPQAGGHVLLQHTLYVEILDEAGQPVPTGTRGEITLTGGFNVFPREVEDVVAEHPAVAQVCVIGAPDDKWGEAVTAVIVLRPDHPSDDAAVATLTAEIQDAVKERKGSVQSPKQVIVVDSVPVTALGKPDKKAVRAKFWEGTGRSVG
jgi:fatty-acyl-CoA synthase